MLNKKDLNYFRKKLSENEVNEILGMYNVILNDPQKRKDLNETSKYITSGLTTFDIVDSKISVLALMSIIFSLRYCDQQSEGLEAFSERYGRMYCALYRYIFIHATLEDLYTFRFILINQF